MTEEKFKEIYLNYKTHKYPEETVLSVKKSYVSYENKQQAVEDSKLLRTLSHKEAVSDAKDFFNCLKLCYCGYDYFLTDEKCDEIQKSVLRKIKFWPGKISNLVLCWFLYKSLKNLIEDNHFTISAVNRNGRYQKLYIAYVSDLVVLKVPEGFKVIKGDSVFEREHLFLENEIQDFLLPTIFNGDGISSEDQCFLLGKYSCGKIRQIKIAGKSVPVHRILCDRTYQQNLERLVEEENYGVVNHGCYIMEETDSLKEEYFNDGKICNQKKFTILNIAGNYGGNSNFPYAFYLGLNGSYIDNLQGAYLPEPCDIESGTKNYVIKKFDGYKESPESYKGTLFIVMNKGTASSAEMAVTPSVNVKNVVLVGTGTYGCCNFGNCFSYQLENSKIMMTFGNRVFHYKNFYEGKGFMPDYWIDDENPVKVVEEYIKKMH